jgi:nucleoid-associated protein YgaU
MFAMTVILCRALYMNYQKMNELEAALAIVRQEESQAGITVEEVSGNVSKEADIQSGEGDWNDAAEQISFGADQSAGEEQADVTAQAVEISQASNEAQVYLEQGYYVVQQGDNLAEICRKIYKTTDVMDKLCEANGIENVDSIYAGQQLTLPE